MIVLITDDDLLLICCSDRRRRRSQCAMTTVDGAMLWWCNLPPRLTAVHLYPAKILYQLWHYRKGVLKMTGMKMTDHQNCRTWNCKT